MDTRTNEELITSLEDIVATLKARLMTNKEAKNDKEKKKEATVNMAVATKPKNKPVRKVATEKVVAPKQATQPQPEQPAQPVAPMPRRRLPSSVRLTTHEVTCNIGSFAVKQIAERDANELLAHPDVIARRNSQYPDPRRYGVTPHIEAVRVIRRSSKQFTSAPYTVSVTILTQGDDKRAMAWNEGVYTRNKGDQE